MNNEVFSTIDEYINNLVAPQDEALLATQRSIEDADMPQISVSPNQGKLLHVLALLCNAQQILEVGTLGGYSTIWMARALPDDGRLISLEVDAKHAEVARQNVDRAGVGSKVEIRVGKALELMPRLIEEKSGPFDMIFIDADKSPYTEYFQFALKLSRRGTLIVADNVIRDGKVLDAETEDKHVKGIQRFNAALGACSEVTGTIVQLVGSKGHDGMALAVVK